MDSLNKTREELIKELQELQQAHNSLKATIESDLLSHKLTEDALRASEERFQLLFNKAPLGYQSLDFDGNFIEVNQKWLDTLGYDREEVIGKWFGDFLTPAFQDGFRNRFPVFKAQGHIHSEFEMVHKDGTVLFIAFDGKIGYDLNGEFKQTHCILQDITERKKAEQELKRIEWLLTSSPQVQEEQKQAYIPPYGDLVKLNTCRLILDSVGEPILTDIAGDYLNLLNTSSAVYEKNGDYALGIFSSGWCRFMDAASRAICDTTDNRKALDCGRWHCHESCWSRASKTAIDTGQPTDFECDGGIRLYALPIRVDDEIVGAINFGYGEPPRDEKKLRELATNYMVSYEDLRTLAMKYESRPPYIVDLAKQRLMASARMIGEIIKRKQAEDALRKNEENLSITLHSIGDGVISTDINGLIVNMNPIAEKLCGLKNTDALGKPLPEVFKIVNSETRNTVADPVKKVLENGEIVGLANHTVLISQNGTEYQIADSAAPIKNKEGKISGVVLVFSDVTEKYLAEEALRVSESRYRSLFSEMMEGFALHEIICDDCGNPIDSRFLEMNPAFERLTGLNAKQVLGKSILEVLPETEKYWIETYGKVALTGIPEVFENYSKQLNKYYKVSAFCNKKNQFVTVFEDITERKQAEETLKRTKQLLSDSEQIEKVGGWEFNIDTLKQIWTEETFRIYEVDVNYDYTVENGINFYTPDCKPIIENAVQRAIEFNESFDLDLKIITAKGNLRHVHTIGEIDLANRRIFGFFQDITDRKKAEEALRKSQEMMLNSQSVAHICSYSTNLNVTELDKSVWVCSPEFYLIFGIDETYPHTIAGWAGFIHPDHREEMVAYHEYVIKNRISFNHEYKINRVNNGAERWVQGTGELVYDEQGKPVRMFGAIQDITERKLAEDALQNSEAIKNKMVSNIGDVIVIIDKDGINRYKSPNIEKWFGWKPEDVVGNSTWDNVHPEDLEASQKFIQSLANEPNASGTIELRYRNKDGSYCPIEITVVNLLQDPNIKGYLGNYHNISERKKIEQELISAKEKAEESDRLKTAFLQNMSHEIRTPMNAIMGFSELLVKHYNNKPKLEKFSEIINLRCNDLLDIINGILDIAKIESGQLSVIQEECNLNVLFDELKIFFTEHQKRIGKQHVRFDLQAFCEPSEMIVVTDKVKLKQIFINLISNAFKFTETGKIEGGCKFDENKNLLFFVSDTGIGIPYDKQQMIFERFAQVEHGSNRLYGGTGLGLSIVRGLVNLLGGEMFIESEIGKGSTFSFVIPCEKSQEIQPETKVSDALHDYSFRNKIILIVEDDIYNAEYLKEILNDKGLTILHAIYGKESVEIATQQTVDLVLMDIRLPDIDGYEATRQIRKQKPHLKIIAQTAYAAQDEIFKAIDSGCIDYICKPTKQELLLEMINKHLT